MVWLLVRAESQVALAALELGLDGVIENLRQTQMVSSLPYSYTVIKRLSEGR
jgi:hypothetical protein